MNTTKGRNAENQEADSKGGAAGEHLERPGRNQPEGQGTRKTPEARRDDPRQL